MLKAAGGLEKAERLELRLAEQEFTGEQMMVILCDRYGNEKSLLLKRDDFGDELSWDVEKPAKVGGKST